LEGPPAGCRTRGKLPPRCVGGSSPSRRPYRRALRRRVRVVGVRSRAAVWGAASHRPGAGWRVRPDGVGVQPTASLRRQHCRHLSTRPAIPRSRSNSFRLCRRLLPPLPLAQRPDVLDVDCLDGYLVAATAALPLAWLGTRIRARRAAPLNSTCDRCGYDLRATPERCPECGAVARTRPPITG
jgi:hypothetical protein